MRRNVIAIVLALLPSIVLAQTSADAVAQQAIDFMAGEAWAKARYFAFTFNVEREGKSVASFPQRWDRSTGRYRVSGKQKDGREFVISMDVDRKEGRAWLDGAPADNAPELLERGYRRFINDTYWLLMPLKMLDPGVNRTLEEAKSDPGGRTYQIVKLTFGDKVGLTPGDQYWAWVHSESGLVDRWEMLLQGSPPGEARTVVQFRGFRRVGGLLISTVREEVGKGLVIKLDDLRVEDSVPANAFHGP